MINILVSVLEQVLGEVFGKRLEDTLNKRTLHRALSAAVKRAEERFAQEYRTHDAEIVDALVMRTRFADLPSVQAALRYLLTHPFHDPAASIATLHLSFNDVLPARLQRDRIDEAVTAFLQFVGQEVLYIPQLRELYALAFQKASAENSRDIANHTAALVQSISELRDDIKQLPITTMPLALPIASKLEEERLRPWHNLPQRSYTHFVGRQAELARLTNLMLPYPRSRYFAVTIDGIGGVGKSALALELAYYYHDNYNNLPSADRFEIIIWVSAKRTILTASGIQQRQQTFSTLNDLYREIATVLEEPSILQAEPIHRRGLVEHALTSQRTLLIVDNLEIVDDEELLAFLRELPDPTKVIITTRHRLDFAITIRLTGMPHSDALTLMTLESERKNVDLLASKGGIPYSEELFRRTGGIPLAIVWSISLMSLGYGIEGVLRRLGSGHSDIARFCFTESVSRIQGHDSHELLLALALFERSVSRSMLGDVTGLSDDEIGRDEGLAELLQLSLVNQESDQFSLLPLTRSYALDELKQHPDLEQKLREQWVARLVALAQPYADLRWHWPIRRQLLQEGKHLVTLFTWSEQAARPDILLQILPALSLYYDMTGEWADRLATAQIGLDYARLTGDLESLVIIETHIMAWVFSQQRRHEEAESYIVDALNVARQMGSVAWQCEVLTRYSQILRHQGLFEKAMDRCQQALELAPQLADPQKIYVKADIEYEMGKVAVDRGDWQTARSYFLSARRVFREDIDNPTFNLEIAWALFGNLGYVMQQLGERETALQIYLQCLDYCRVVGGGKGHMLTILIRLAALEELQGNNAVALEYAREALEWGRQLRMPHERTQAEVICRRLGGDIS